MEITLLGTGAADGWPNPFCRCASCSWAREAAVVRTPTCLLVDGRLLLDAGPAPPQQAVAAGVDLAGVRTAVVTHAHTDHLDPAILLHRGWVRDDPLTVAGPRPVMDACHDWLDPASTVVTLAELTAGDDVVLDGYRVTALPARHEALGECLLYALEDADGASVLYATDTGPGWLEGASGLLEGRRFDAVFCEETFGDADLSPQHLTLPTFAAEIGRLRALGCVDDATRVVAVHLSHHNPPGPELAARLARSGATAPPEGTRLRIAPAARTP